MTGPAQVLDRTLTCYRIGDPNGAHPIFHASGSRLYPGRWNTPGAPVIYASRCYSTAMLEKLAHGSGRLPPNQHYIVITVPRGATYEMVESASLPGWDSPDESASRAHGAAWRRERRSVAMIVPSVVARVDENVVINPEHPEFRLIETGLHRPVFWDRRFYP